MSVAAEEMDAGIEYVFAFRLRPTHPGRYHVLPARAFAMYEPDRRGNSMAFVLRVRD